LNILDIISDSKKPIVISEQHNLSESFSKPKMFDKLDGVVTVTQKLKDHLVEEYELDLEKCLVCHDGVDLIPYRTSVSKKELRKELGLPRDRKIVMYTGHLYPRKGVHLLIKAAKNIDAEIYVVGGYKEDIDRLNSNYDVDVGNLNFTGFVNPSSIHKYQLSSDILVAPYTKKAWMPSPLKLFEYMAAGKPIVASKIDTIQEVLKHEENALLFKPEDTESLTRNINRLLEDNELCEKTRENALEDVKEYSWKRRANKIKNFIEKKQSENNGG